MASRTNADLCVFCGGYPESVVSLLPAIGCLLCSHWVCIEKKRFAREVNCSGSRHSSTAAAQQLHL